MNSKSKRHWSDYSIKGLGICWQVNKMYTYYDLAVILLDVCTLHQMLQNTRENSRWSIDKK